MVLTLILFFRSRLVDLKPAARPSPRLRHWLKLFMCLIQVVANRRWKKNRDKAEHLKHEKGFVYKVIKLFATYGTFLCSFCFRNSKTPTILRVIARGCTSTPSFKKPSIACGSRTNMMKEYSSRPYSRACPFQQLHFFWLRYVFFFFLHSISCYITQLARLDWSQYWWVADWNQDRGFLLCRWIPASIHFTLKVSGGFCRL